MWSRRTAVSTARWLVSDAAPALVIGLFIIATVAASVGYLVSSFAWRWWIGHKRRTRLLRLAIVTETTVIVVERAE
jgi:hypothetical protein